MQEVSRMLGRGPFQLTSTCPERPIQNPNISWDTLENQTAPMEALFNGQFYRLDKERVRLINNRCARSALSVNQ